LTETDVVISLPLLATITDVQKGDFYKNE